MISRTKAFKPDVAEIVTNQILDALEKGVIPWQKPWKTLLPMNMVSKRRYHGINLLILALSEHTSPYYLTFNQVSALGGNVKPGSRSYRVVYWRLLEHINASSGEITEIPMMRYYCIFNLEQCTGIPEDKIPKTDQIDFNPIEACEEIVNHMPNKPKVISAREAYYNRIEDVIGMPAQNAFISPEERYSTLFHELGHSTGHPKRLNRENKYEKAGFEDVYSNEELVAEISSSILCAYAGISPRTIQNQAAYIQHWLKRLKDDKRLIVAASSLAQKAADYIMHQPGEVNYNACTWLGDYYNI
jgi:antirestriction protein ArdC